MDLSELNVRLLLMFHEVYRTGSVSRAAQELGLSQPNVTVGLNKLRTHFKDPLFVRTGGRMEATPQGHEFAKRIDVALRSLNDAFDARTAFEPATSERSFCIAMTEIMQIAVLPNLFSEVFQAAPSVKISVRRPGPETLRELENGTVDIALGYFLASGPNFHEQALYQRDFVCIARREHPRIRDTLTLDQFYAEKHVVHRATGASVIEPESAINRKGMRDIALSIPDLAGIDAVVAASDLIATVPRVIASLFIERSPIRIFDHPVQMSPYVVKFHWHDRFHRDPANGWLRGLVTQAFDAWNNDRQKSL